MLRKKKSFFTIKKKTFWKSQKSLFSIGVKCQFFCLCRFSENYTWNNASDFPQEKKTFWTIYIYIKRIFQSRKSHFFLKCLIQPFDQKSQILLYLDLAITRLEKLLSHFAEKKKPVLTIKNGIFQSPKNPLFQRG